MCLTVICVYLLGVRVNGRDFAFVFTKSISDWSDIVSYNFIIDRTLLVKILYQNSQF